MKNIFTKLVMFGAVVTSLSVAAIEVEPTKKASLLMDAARAPLSPAMTDSNTTVQPTGSEATTKRWRNKGWSSWYGLPWYNFEKERLDYYANGNVECFGRRCVNGDTNAFWGLTFTPSYRNTYVMKVYPMDEKCSSEDGNSHTPLELPKNSYFRETLDLNSQTEEKKVVHVYEVTWDGKDGDATEEKFFNDSYQLCIQGKLADQKNKYQRVGGLATGVLVIPFKLRDRTDIYSDSSIGPYLSYRYERVDYLVSIGLTKVGISEVGSSKVETKDGITFALGASIEVAKDWDIAFVVGKDRLSGETGKSWEYQDKTWFSFAIGYNFTR